MITLSDVAQKQLVRRVAFEQAENFRRVDLREGCINFLMGVVHRVKHAKELRHAYTNLTVSAKNWFIIKTKREKMR